MFHNVGNDSVDPVYAQVQINGKPLTMELNTGAALSIISDETRKAVFPEVKLRPSDLVLKRYTNESMQVMGTLNVRGQYEDQLKKLVLVVIPYSRLFSWVENFVKSRKRSSEIIFVVLNFVDAMWGVDRG